MRPSFLTSPGVWLHSRRISQTAADYACAVEQSAPRNPYNLGTLAAAVVTVAGCIFIGYCLAQGV